MIESDPEEEEEEEDIYIGARVGIFFVFEKLTSRDNAFWKNAETTSIVRYAHPEMFVPPDEYVEGKDYYCSNDPHYDQDDYWYEPFTADKIIEKVDERMPDKVQIPLVRKA